MFLQTETMKAEGVVRPALRIVVADDEHDTVQTLSMLLTDEGHDVYGVHDGPSVVPLVRKLRPDAVILDIGMPGMNGYDLARALKEEHGPHCPTLIAVSAYGRPSDKLIGRAAGFDHYFGKPVTMDDLLAALPKKRRFEGA